MSAAPKAKHRSPKQVAASRANLVKARAAQRRSGASHHRTAKQRAASAANLAKARAAQKSRRAGKTPVKAKTAKAPWPGSLGDCGAGRVHGDGQMATGLAPSPQLNAGLGWLDPSENRFSLHQLPACGPVALAEHLALFTGMHLAGEDVLALHNRAGAVPLAELLERVAAEGMAGPDTKLAHYEPCDPGTAVPGLIYGVNLPGIGYHAVLLHPDGVRMQSWGQVLPLAGQPEEAWWLEWEAE